MHWAQAKVYASILAIQHDLESVDVQLTYVQLESLACHEDRRTFEREELLAFFEDVITRYMHWAQCTGTSSFSGSSALSVVFISSTSTQSSSISNPSMRPLISSAIPSTSTE